MVGIASLTLMLTLLALNNENITSGSRRTYAIVNGGVKTDIGKEDLRPHPVMPCLAQPPRSSRPQGGAAWSRYGTSREPG